MKDRARLPISVVVAVLGGLPSWIAAADSGLYSLATASAPLPEKVRPLPE
jgi:hypothetical protein